MNDQELDALLNSWQAPSPSPATREALRQALPPAHRRRPYGWMAAAAGIVAAIFLLGVASMGSGQARLADGTYVKTSLQVDPPSARQQMPKAGHVLLTRGSSQQGYFFDPATQTYTGYKLAVKPFGDGTYLTSVEPATKTLAQVSSTAGAGNYRQVPLPGPTVARVVREGEAFEIALLVAPGGARVYERIELSRGEPPSFFDHLGDAIRAHHMMLIHWIHGLFN